MQIVDNAHAIGIDPTAEEECCMPKGCMHLQDMEHCLRDPSLLLLTVISENVKFLPQRIHITNSRVSGQGPEPSSHWQLQANTILSLIAGAVDQTYWLRLCSLTSTMGSWKGRESVKRAARVCLSEPDVLCE